MSKAQSRTVLTCAALTAALAGAVLVPAAAYAHGYIEGDELTTRAAMPENGDLGPANWDKQSLEALKGFPAAGPADGEFASAGHDWASILDEQSEDRWAKNEVSPGEVSVDWTIAANHMTTKWQYFMTTEGWDPNDKLDRADFELIDTIEHDGSPASNGANHTITIPEDRDGYHVIYAVWTVADTPNAFYNVIDVDVQGDGGSEPDPEEPDTEDPSMVNELWGTPKSATSAEIAWNAASDNVAVDQYEVNVNGKVVATVDGKSTSATVTGLKADTLYTATVHAIDAAGNRGGSKITAFQTLAEGAEDTTRPSAPTGLHTMNITADSIDLMWTESTDDTAVVEYKVWDAEAGEYVATTSGTTATIDGLTANKGYAYTIYAFDAAGNMSDSSNIVFAFTSEEDAGSELPTWDPYAAYTEGDKVTYEGENYIAVNSYTGVGDPSWITALSLWNKI